MNMKKALTILILCFFSTMVIGGERLPSLLISNPWKLSSTSKGSPNELNIQEYIITFKTDGTWAYTSVLDGQFEGVKTKGSGTWLIKESVLIYTAGDNTGESNISIENSLLKLSPDPVLVFEGKEEIDTTYVSLK
jgi:hypothetical protein